MVFTIRVLIIVLEIALNSTHQSVFKATYHSIQTKFILLKSRFQLRLF